MPRRPRVAPGGLAYHVMNRGVGRMRLFSRDSDYEAFERVLAEARQRGDMRICAYVIMPNHWHLVLWPRRDGELSQFVGWLTMTHAQRWRAFRDSIGIGHLYQGRFKSFPIESDGHFLRVCRYVEQNPLRAGLVQAAQDWRWSSLWLRASRSDRAGVLLDSWPVERPARWMALVNAAPQLQEVRALQHCIRRGCPFGDSEWVQRTALRLGLDSALRAVGRPPKRGQEPFPPDAGVGRGVRAAERKNGS